MKERDIARVLFHHVQQKQHAYCCSSTHCVPNVGECDFLSITKSGFLHEYEIKTSLADFKADFRNKPDKHKRMKGVPVSFGRYRRDEKLDLVRAEDGKYIFDEGQEIQKPFVNYFWFVCPEGLIKEDEVPDYAGLIYIKHHIYNEGQSNQWEETRASEMFSPKRFHNNKVGDKFIIKMLRSMMFKYFTHN